MFFHRGIFYVTLNKEWREKMEYSIQLNHHYPQMELRKLLEEEWLIPRKVRHFLRVRKNVLVNHAPYKFHEMVQSGDLITLKFEESDYSTPSIRLGQNKLVHVLYEDEHLLILEKPCGMKTHPNSPDERDTLLNHAAAYLAEQKQFPYIVHRLDKETSGVVLMAKNPFVLPILGRLLEQKKIDRTYQALVHGQLKEENLVIQKKIGRDRHDRRKRCIDPQNGQNAITKVHRLKMEQTHSQIECELLTGRTHQIRVHLLSIGHPILGDPLYAPNTKHKYQRLMLHAKQMRLLHPFTQEQMIIQSAYDLWS